MKKWMVSMCMVAALAACANETNETEPVAAVPLLEDPPVAESGVAESVGATPVSPSAAAALPYASEDFRAVIAKARAKVLPAVLYVRCQREDASSGKKRTDTVSGSAFLISEDGEFVTNWHVVDKAKSIRVLLSDGRHYDAEFVGSDKSMDIALCKIKLPEGETTPFATFGSSANLDEGDFVIAMGAPWGLNRSVTFGTISCARRYLAGNSEYVLWIQTDASIGPGNSGGPLVNTDGEIVGVNALGTMLPTANFGFAIPSDEAVVILDQLRKNGKVNWSWSGLELQPLRDFERNVYFDAERGVIVAGTAPDSPAREAGILPRDNIITINGEPMDGTTEESLPALRRKIGLLPDSADMVVQLVRNGETKTVTVSPNKKGAVEGEEKELKRWDFSVKTINKFETPSLYFRRPEGVYVFGISYPGNAQNSNLREKDIIVSINGTEINSLDDLTEFHKKSLDAPEKKLLITVLRGARNREIVLDYSRDFERE